MILFPGCLFLFIFILCNISPCFLTLLGISRILQLLFLASFSSAEFNLLWSRYETVDMTTRLLVPIIVLQNHNRYNIMEKGHNYSIDVEAIEAEVRSP